MPRLVAALAWALGLSLVANGVAMLLAPLRWYGSMPAVMLTGAYNAHFVRDIGLFSALIGAALIAGALRPAQRAVLWSLAAAGLGGHAVLHLVEVAAGICGPDAIVRDFPGVTLPALIAAALAASALRRPAAKSPSAASS